MSLLNVEGRGVQQSHVLLSRTRSFQLLEGTARLVNVDTPPSVWPAIFLSGLHFTSMAMAMMVWVDACAMANPAVADGKGAVIADTQNLYSRLLAVNAMCEFITSSAIGSLSDRFGRRVLAISAQLGQVIDYFMAGLALQPVFTSLQTPTALVSQSLYLSRGVAGLMGNVKISLGAYIADISTAADCPGRAGGVGQRHTQIELHTETLAYTPARERKIEKMKNQSTEAQMMKLLRVAVQTQIATKQWEDQKRDGKTTLTNSSSLTKLKRRKVTK